MTEPDPIAEAFNNYVRPPRDVVPKPDPTSEASPIPSGPGIPYYNDEIGDDGVTRETGTAYVRFYNPNGHVEEGDA